MSEQTRRIVILDTDHNWGCLRCNIGEHVSRKADVLLLKGESLRPAMIGLCCHHAECLEGEVVHSTHALDSHNGQIV